MAIDDLLNMGAVINTKNNEKQSPFHFAARYAQIIQHLHVVIKLYGYQFLTELIFANIQYVRFQRCGVFRENVNFYLNLI